ncbi:3,4-dihydroxy-2-butanone-4-phosphate synthase [Microcoleus sp.]|uniref:3,4-dihydroxy-2-butanone-4-phosphate synthase n=1 Tax=Microcoleus sp. TaxID=44472 RepID=UPI0035934EFF
MSTEFSDYIATVEDLIEEARNGRMFILVDHEDRENEGDLVIPAQMATPDAINFMATHGRGLICLAMTSERLDRLGLPLMAAANRGIVRSELGDKQGAIEDLQKAAQLFKAQGQMAYYEKAMELWQKVIVTTE